ncbi:helix-turn-helix domain-containing protein [Pseudodesulfovibrio sp. JC047]|uniref:helix-turn-helix domain-containing protein n=1 Tax=Pseudodesulfovibrio sp. JC047 TaxID=2683199 RepID=UPI0013CFF819|nr:helix-turn-helix transcriptional regulator [Pseudodesulfovibrio sp. JC047]NDV20363.1 helix-turn-helix domain-containing protein [Pseudodesulfovibrio sp. JC047]
MKQQQESQIKKLFGVNLRAIRKDEGLTQEALALKCGLDRTYIGGIERGERNVSLINIHKIADALGIYPTSLLNYPIPK